ncbi:hypothetical protein EBF04_19080 [Streptomyces sp. I6]|nr:hypothetical protein EBF04_19080 [Streptomyces sp. I6]
MPSCLRQRIMAGLRHLAVDVHRQDGHTNIAAALRHTARNHPRPSPPSAWHDEPEHKITSQRPCHHRLRPVGTPGQEERPHRPVEDMRSNRIGTPFQHTP